MDREENVSPVNGGCWYCRIKDSSLVFCWEFDTFIHIECIKKENFISYVIKPDPPSILSRIIKFFKKEKSNEKKNV